MSTPLLDLLLDLLQQQYDQLVRMNELLVSEREAITSRSPEKVVLASQQKAELLQQLQQTDQQISTQFSAADLQHESIKPLRNDIDNLLTEIKHHNEVNGKIIENNQVTVKMLKGILFDSKKDQSSMTYNQMGQKTAASRYKPIKA